MGTQATNEVLTLLTGDLLSERKSTSLSFAGVINAISVNYDQISNFYTKYKKKWALKIKLSMMQCIFWVQGSILEFEEHFDGFFLS